MKRDDFDFRAFFEGFKPELKLDLGEKLICDLFAGGGGMSTAIEWALGRPPHIAINHSDDALSMHQANHPQTNHMIANVLEVCPHQATQGRPVGLLHGSPDCRHFSQASGGQPRSEKIRALSWVLYRWAAQVRPDIITLENVESILLWSPLVAKRDKITGRVIKLDRTVAAPGEYVPRHEQFLVPDPKRLGKTWRQFVAALEALGYVVEWQVGCAADYGAPTTRERLFMIARCDSQPIVWPEPTHFRKPTAGQMKWRAAAEVIDFSRDCPSIFDRELRGKKPLVVNTLRRIGRGTKRCVIDSTEPFLIPHAVQGSVQSVDFRQPLASINPSRRGHVSLIKPAPVPPNARSTHAGRRLHYSTVQHYSPCLISAMLARRQPDSPVLAAGMLVKFRFNADGLPLDRPLPVITAGGSGPGRPAGAAHALGLSTVFLAQMNGGFNDEFGVIARDARKPMSTITQSGSQQQLVSQNLVPATSGGLSAAHVIQLRQNCDARPVDEPVRTISAQGLHHGVVETTLGELQPGTRHLLSEEHEAKALRVARFMLEYADLGIAPEQAEAMTKEELLALVTVMVNGVAHVIIDIGLRMMEPDELFLAQGFPRDYRIKQGHDGRIFTKEKQVRMCGNSVSPYHGAAIIAANCPHLRTFSEADLRRLSALNAA